MIETDKKIIVISAINIFNGGPLSILNDCLTNLHKNYSDSYKIIALVHNHELINTKEITCIDFPLSRKSYVFRLYYEYIHFRKMSLYLKPYLWLSLHDMTPNVRANRQAVYCHNSTPYFKPTLKDLYYEPSTFFFSFLYKYLYRINIKKNNLVIVQQNWLRDEFKLLFKMENIISVHPDFTINTEYSFKNSNQPFTFFYPSLPRVFKNFEIIAEAVKIILKRKNTKFRVKLTVDGSENKYSKNLVKKYSGISEIEFIGLQKRDEVFKLYSETHCLIFPSKLESWGLPLSEFKVFKMPIIASDLPYAKETLGDYNKVCYFNPDSAIELANLMIDVMDNKMKYDEGGPAELPDAVGWSELLDILIN